MRESSSYGVTLKIIEATLGFEGEHYPYNQMIISSFSVRTLSDYLRHSPGI